MNLYKIIDFPTGKLMEFDYDSTVFKIEYTFRDHTIDDKDYPGMYDYDYEYRIIEFKEQIGYAIIISSWHQEGMILGCPDCALHNIHTVFISTNSDVASANREMVSLRDGHSLQFGILDEQQTSKTNTFFQALSNVQLPSKVYYHFLNELQEAGYIKLQLNSYK